MTSKLDLIKRTRAILGPNGECWGKHFFLRDGKYCLTQALWEADRQLRHEDPAMEYDYSIFASVKSKVTTAVGGSIVGFNDRFATTWHAVNQVLLSVEESLR